jgi:hypothetical protein
MSLSYSVEIIDINDPEIRKTFTHVTSDGILQDQQQRYIPYRYLVLNDQTRLEFPMERYLTRFSPERALVAEANLRSVAQKKDETEPQPKFN